MVKKPEESAESQKPKVIKVGADVKLLVGSPDVRGKVFKVIKMKGEKIFLEGYVVRRTAKITQQNQENYISVNKSVHISNLKAV